MKRDVMTIVVEHSDGNSRSIEATIDSPIGTLMSWYMEPDGNVKIHIECKEEEK